MNAFQSGDFQNEKDLILSKKNSGDDTLNPVLHASVCWTFRTQDHLSLLNPDPRPYSNQIDASVGNSVQGFDLWLNLDRILIASSLQLKCCITQ